jgi:hypothetical protein
VQHRMMIYGAEDRDLRDGFRIWGVGTASICRPYGADGHWDAGRYKYLAPTEYDGAISCSFGGSSQTVRTSTNCFPTLATHPTWPYNSSQLASVYFSLLRKCGLVIANGIGSVVCLGTASVLAGLLYGEVSTARVFMLLLLILLFLAAGFYLFIRCLKVISPRRRIGGYPWRFRHHEPK